MYRTKYVLIENINGNWEIYRNTEGLDSNKINDSTIMINMQFICLGYLPALLLVYPDVLLMYTFVGIR